MLKLELKKVSHNKSLSEETPAYTAQVWIDGKHFCDVSNHGTGGCDHQHPIKGTTNSDIDAMNERIKAEFPKQSYIAAGETRYYDTDLEFLCQEALMDHDLMKMVKRDLAKKILFIKSDGKVYECPLSKVPADKVPGLIAQIKLKHGIDKVLNELTVEEVVAIYKAQ